MHLNETERTQSQVTLPLELSNCFTYLGISMVPDVNEMPTVNYDPILQSIESIDSRSNLPIPTIGRINIVKRNILPKLLYLFQNIPLSAPSCLFPD